MKAVLDCPGLLSFFADGETLYTCQQVKDHIVFRFFETDSFEELGEFRTQMFLNHQISPHFDDDCLYLPTTDGLVLGLDKFCGEHLVTCRLGPMWPVGLFYTNSERLFSLCAIPLSSGKSQMTICASDKMSGEKLYQSMSMPSESATALFDNQIFVAAGDYLYAFDYELRPTWKAQLGPLDYPPIRFRDQVWCSSSKGTISIIKRRCGSFLRKIFVARNRVAPVQLENSLYWFSDSGLYKVHEAAIRHVEKTPLECICPPVLHNGKIYGVGSDTRMVFDPTTNKVHTSKHSLSQEKTKMVSCGNALLLFYGEQLWDVSLT